MNNQPKITRVYPQPDRVLLTCTYNPIAFFFSLIYNNILVIASAVCAIQTRKLPDNFNEALFINFCVYSTIVVHISFILGYFTVNDSIQESMFICLSVILTAYIILFCFFAPKVYAVYFVDEEKQHISQVKKISCNCSKDVNTQLAMKKISSSTNIIDRGQEVESRVYSVDEISRITSTPMDTPIIYQRCMHNINGELPDLISTNLPNQIDSHWELNRTRWNNTSQNFLLPVCEHHTMINPRRDSPYPN